MSVCPICEATFPASQIQRHANECIERRMREMEAPAEPARRASPPRAQTARAPVRAASPPRAAGRWQAATPVRPAAAAPLPAAAAALAPAAARRAPSPPRLLGRPSAAASTPAASAAASSSGEPSVVRPQEVEDLLDAIHIRRFDRDIAAGDAGGRRTAAVAAAVAAAELEADSLTREWSPVVSCHHTAALREAELGERTTLSSCR